MEVISGVSRVRSSVPCCWVTAKRLSGRSGRTMRSMQVLEYRTQRYGGKNGGHAILLRDYFDASVASLAASRHTDSMVPSRSPVHDNLWPPPTAILAYRCLDRAASTGCRRWRCLRWRCCTRYDSAA